MLEDCFVQLNWATGAQLPFASGTNQSVINAAPNDIGDAAPAS